MSVVDMTIRGLDDSQTSQFDGKVKVNKCNCSKYEF